MAEPIICLAPELRLAEAAAEEMAARLPGVSVRHSSMRSYVRRLQAPRRVILCAGGQRPEDDLEFLRAAARRLLWKAPPEDFRDAIGGLRTEDARPRRTASSKAPAGATGLAAALLLEGRVDPARARAALRSSAARHWIVESPRHVRIPESLVRVLGRAGVWWTALEPVEVVGLYLSPALARARAKWKGLFPTRTRVWVTDPRLSSRSPRR